MHTLLILSSLALALAACLLCAGLLGRARSEGSRRAVQVVGLLVPAVLLGLLTVLMAHFVSQVCFLSAPPADVAIAQGLSLIGATGIAVAIILNGARAVLLPVHLRRRTWEAPAWLHDKVAALVPGMGLRKAPRVRVAADVRPWALVAGLFKPHLVVSSGLAVLLDGEELDAVLCHELLHIRRGDLWWATAGAVLRDLTWFLPATSRLYELMLSEQELACDDHVVGEARRLALASALARVWQAQIKSGPAPRGALALFSSAHDRTAHTDLEVRVRRLLDHPGTTVGSTLRRALLMVVAVLGLFVPAQLGASLIAMDAMGCNLNQIFSIMAR